MKSTMLFIGVLALAISVLLSEPGQSDPPIAPAEGERSLDPDPFADGHEASLRNIDAERSVRRTISVLVRFESYDVPAMVALALLDSWKVKDGADDLRSQVVDLAKTEQATIQDLKAATVEAGSKATLEAIHEYNYPVEYEGPGGFPNLKKENLDAETPLGKLLQRVNNHFLPTSFETRNLGNTLEFEIGLVSAEEAMWDVRIAPELVELAGIEKWGPEGAQVEMPKFNSIRVSTSTRVRDGVWTLVAMQTPYDGTKPQSELKRLQFIKVERAR